MGDQNLLLDILGDGPLAAFILALVAVLGAFSRGLWDWLKGRHDRERSHAKDRRDTVSELKSEVRAAEAEADQARAALLDQQRRFGLVWEYAHALRRYCISRHGDPPEALPPWPNTD